MSVVLLYAIRPHGMMHNDKLYELFDNRDSTINKKSQTLNLAFPFVFYLLTDIVL